MRPIIFRALFFCLTSSDQRSHAPMTAFIFSRITILLKPTASIFRVFIRWAHAENMELCRLLEALRRHFPSSCFTCRNFSQWCFHATKQFAMLAHINFFKTRAAAADCCASIWLRASCNFSCARSCLHVSTYSIHIVYAPAT